MVLTARICMIICSISRREASTIFRASSFALARSSAFSRSSFSRSAFSSSASLSCSARACSASSISSSARRFFISASDRIASKSVSSFLMNAFALSSIYSSIPSRRLISNAFDLPGMPIKSRYVGQSLSTSNSMDAFSIPGRVSANALISL